MIECVGQQLGNYRLLRLLGQGGQASVYLGEHIHLKSQAFDVECCTDALARLLPRRSEFRHNLAQVRASYRQHDGAREAARMLLRLADAP